MNRIVPKITQTRPEKDIAQAFCEELLQKGYEKRFLIVVCTEMLEWILEHEKMQYN